jgi:hypothetical protein
MARSSSSSDLLDPKKMDGPVVRWTVNDLFKCNSDPRLYLGYHVVAAGFDALAPVGCLLGAGVWYGGGASRLFLSRRPYPPTTTTTSLLSSMGTFGFGAGCLGMMLGAAGMYDKARQGAAASPLPWTNDGIQQRVDGLSHNFKVRILDLSAWSGVAVAATALVAMGRGSAVKLGFSAGTRGVVEALTIGSSLGSLSAMACIYATLPKMDDDDDGDE